MDLLCKSRFLGIKYCGLHLHAASLFLGRDKDICGCRWSPKFTKGYGGNIRALASQNQAKKFSKRGKPQKRNKDVLPSEQLPDEDDGLDRPLSRVDYVEEGNKMLSSDASDVQISVIVPSRSDVLQACAITSSFIGALGVFIRQVSHVASQEGFPVVDCSADITFGIESWHLELILGSVMMVSSCRLLLLKTWPEFAESSEAANQQVLTSLKPLDYLLVAFLPGISEELLFRGALLPLFGISWTSIFATAALFGALHLGSGRKYSFAIWATFVGLVYGYAATLSSSVVVPMASHALNNLVGGIIWKYSCNPSKQTG